MRPGRRLVLRIWLAKAAEPACGVHALFKCYEAAICHAATHPTAINRAPRIVLGLGARPYCNSSDIRSTKSSKIFIATSIGHDSELLNGSELLTLPRGYLFGALQSHRR